MLFDLEFLGAAGGVTGSRTLVTSQGRCFLVDCGLFQGPKEIRNKNREPVAERLLKANAIILTHAHLDHSGYLPVLFRAGYRGPVYCSEGTADLLPVMLSDAAHLEEEAARFANKTGYSFHKPALPLFTQKDVDLVLSHLKPQKRHEWVALASDISFQYIAAGHIVGASMIQFSFSHENRNRLLTFSGDIGHDRMLTLRPPETLLETDVLVLESTYGDRLHKRSDAVAEFADVANRTFKRGGVLVIPAFAVGRAQEILYMIRVCEDRGLIPKVPTILDSPMASTATRIYFAHREDHRERYREAEDASQECCLPELFGISETIDDSLLATMREGPGIVISAAGMLNGGRILHHLKIRLPHEENTVLFCGYQAEGTKGRFLQENASQLSTLRIHHEEVEVNAEIATIASLSAHGDWQDILSWLGAMSKPPKQIVLNHGDPEAMTALAKALNEKFPATSVLAITEPQSISPK